MKSGGKVDMLGVVSQIERERGVEREIVLLAIEQAIQQAARKNPLVTNDLRVAIDRRDLSLHVYDTLVVSAEETGTGFISPARAKRFNPEIKEGETIEIELPAAGLGRIAAQTSRQVIMQKIRDAERSNTFAEFKNRVGDIVNGTVTAINHRDVFVMVGKTEMLLPGKERLPNEEYQVGDSISAVIHRVRENADSGPSVVISRASNEFLRAMMRRDVSEIAEGVVEIMGIARDPGYRAKVAVRSHDPKVEPVGACVGLRGIRVRNFVRELNGEKIDMVRWNEDIRQYVAAALSPAKLDAVEVDPASPNTVKVTVSPEQYTLAIGKRGQNVRLTTKLVGYQVTVSKSLAMASFEDRKAAAIKSLADLLSISTSEATQLADAGFLSVDGIVETNEAGLDAVTATGVYAAAKVVAEMTK